MQKAKIIGVIGETGSGKSTFSRYIQNLYTCLVIDTDQIGHDVLEESDIKQALVDRYSEAILCHGLVDRKHLGTIVFQDKKELTYLSQLTHPRIREHIVRKTEENMQDYAIILVDGVALVEANIHLLCDYIIYIHTAKEIRLKRLVEKRNIPYKRAEAMIASQKIRSVYANNSDYTVSLDQGIESKKKEIQNLLQEIL